MIKVVLASQSPRRKELLKQMGVMFEVVPSDFDEQLDDARMPEEVAIELALGKAQTVAEQHPDAIVIGSDTIVTIEGKQLGKPRDAQEAKEMLTMLSGKENEVTTGLAVMRKVDGVQLMGSATAKVQFKPHNEAAIDAYVATGDPYDKAGAYGIQSGAAPLIAHVEGDYDIILGLPTKLLCEFLSEFGVIANPVQLTPPVAKRSV